jgi:hypothetical protein
MRRLVEEVRRFSSESAITFDAVQSLPYLRAVVNESLRSKPCLGRRKPSRVRDRARS